MQIVFKYYNYQTSCKKSEKTNEPFLRNIHNIHTKFRNIHRKTFVLESLFVKVAVFKAYIPNCQTKIYNTEKLK